MKTKILLLLVVFLLASQNVAFAAENELLVEEETEIIEVVSDEEKENVLSYKEIVEEVVKTLNARDSYFFEIKNPDDYIQYIKDLGIDAPQDVNQEMTRAEFAVLLTSLTEKVTKQPNYSTDLIDINTVFSDLSGLSDETVNAIKIVFIEGLMGGTDKNIFAPNEIIDEFSLKFVLERLSNGYNREKLFSVVDSCFTNEEKKSVLKEYGYISEENENNEDNYNDTDIIETENQIDIASKESVDFIENTDVILKKGELSSLLVELNEDVMFETTDAESSVLIRDVIDYFNIFWKTPGTLFRVDTEKNYHYLAEDTSFLSNEEWEYLKTHLDSEITLSEFLILYDRVKELETDMVNLVGFDSWDKIITYSGKYLRFIYPMIEKNKDCFDFFLDFDNENFKIVPYHFARAVHECQHEEFLSIAGASFSREKSMSLWGTWAINPRRDPKTFYYYDYTKSFWVDSKMNKDLPATAVMFEHYPEEIKEDNTIKNYVIDKDSSANILGLQGLLSEFCSFAVEAKVQAVSFSLGMNNANFHSLDYDNYLKMELLVKDYLLYLKEFNPELYDNFMSDTDTIRMINNIVKDLDIIEKLYPWHIKEYTDKKLLNWETEIVNSYFW